MDEANQNLPKVASKSSVSAAPVETPKKPPEVPVIAEKVNLTRKSHSQGSIHAKDYAALAKKLDVTLFQPPSSSSAAANKPVVKKSSKTNHTVKRTSSKDDEISNLATKMKNSTPLNPAKAAKVLTEHTGALKLIAPENVGRIRAMVKSATKGNKTSAPIPEDSKNNNNSSAQAKTSTGVSPTRATKKAPVAAITECHLSNVLRSAQRCLDHLRDVRESLSNLVAEDETLSKGFKVVEQSPEIARVAQIAETITLITRDAFIPAHRLNQTTIALYNAEDFLRYPSDLRTFDIATTGRIKLPDASFNAATLEKMRGVVDKATSFYNKFDGKGTHSHEIQDILFTQMRAMQDLYACTLGCQEVFKILMYTTAKEKHHLQQFLLSLPSMERSDMLTEVQELRRLIDELVIVLEKLSWGAFVVFRLATGKTSIHSTDDTQGGPFGKLDSNSLTLYPGYPGSFVKGSGKGSRTLSPAGEKLKSKVSVNSAKAKKTDGDKFAKEIQTTANKASNSSSGEAKSIAATKKSVKNKTRTKGSNTVAVGKVDSDHKTAEKADASEWMQMADKLSK